jgi:hypothetical protein
MATFQATVTITHDLVIEIEADSQEEADEKVNELANTDIDLIHALNDITILDQGSEYEVNW